MPLLKAGGAFGSELQEWSREIGSLGTVSRMDKDLFSALRSLLPGCPWSGTKGQLRRRGPGISEQYRAPLTNTSPLSPWPGKWAPGPTPSHPDDSQHPFDMAGAQSLGGASINMEGRTTW